MKKVKMMLLSLALFAVVGGALAFKAKFQLNYCTTNVSVDTDNTGLFCPARTRSIPTDDNQIPFVATTTYDGNDCHTVGLRCTTTSIRLTGD